MNASFWICYNSILLFYAGTWVEASIVRLGVDDATFFLIKFTTNIACGVICEGKEGGLFDIRPRCIKQTGFEYPSWTTPEAKLVQGCAHIWCMKLVNSRNLLHQRLRSLDCSHRPRGLQNKGDIYWLHVLNAFSSSAPSANVFAIYSRFS